MSQCQEGKGGEKEETKERRPGKKHRGAGAEERWGEKDEEGN